MDISHLRAARERGERVPDRWEECPCGLPHLIPGTDWLDAMQEQYPVLEPQELDLMLDSIYIDYQNHQVLVKSVGKITGSQSNPTPGKATPGSSDKSPELPGVEETPEARRRRLTRERVQKHREKSHAAL